MTGQPKPDHPGGACDSTAEKLRSRHGHSHQPLEVIWHQFGDQLRRRARTRLRQYGLSSQAESMDICNDVMADMTRRYAEQPVTPDHLLSYLLKAIDNQVLDTFRTLGRQCRDFRRKEASPVDDLAIANRENTPSQIVIRREMLSRIRSMLGEREAIAVNMMLENRDWQEIGDALSVKADTARMRVHRALKRASQQLGLIEESL